MTLFQNVQPVSRIEHAGLKLQPIPGYRFAAEVTEVPVFTHELPHLVSVLPLAFRIGDDGAALVGLTGVDAGHNVFVGPKGAWSAIATPEVLSTYPLAMGAARDGSHVLVADMASQLLSWDEGDPLLTEDGGAGTPVTEQLERLRAQARDRRDASRAIAALHKAGVLVPWAVDDVATLDGAVHHRVNLDALAGLSAEAHAELARANALGLAYGQAYAMANMRKLRRMGRRQGPRQPDVSRYLKGDDELAFDDDAVFDFG